MSERQAIVTAAIFTALVSLQPEATAPKIGEGGGGDAPPGGGGRQSGGFGGGGGGGLELPSLVQESSAGAFA